MMAVNFCVTLILLLVLSIQITVVGFPLYSSSNEDSSSSNNEGDSNSYGGRFSAIYDGISSPVKKTMQMVASFMPSMGLPAKKPRKKQKKKHQFTS